MNDGNHCSYGERIGAQSGRRGSHACGMSIVHGSPSESLFRPIYLDSPYTCFDSQLTQIQF